MTDDRIPLQGGAHQDPCDNGLVAHRDGLDGWILETTATYMNAVGRHEVLLQEFERTRADMSPGASFLLGLVFDDANLTLGAVHAATSRKARCYRDGATVYLEWPRAGGWRGRCKLSRASQSAIARRGGSNVSVEDWRVAARWIQTRSPGLQLKQVWSAFFADAQAWWYQHLAGPAFAHAAELRTLQLLPRAALARRSTRCPQLTGESIADIEELDQARLLLQTARTRTSGVGALSEFGKALREIVARKGDKATARAEIVTVIDRLLPRAVLEGRAQVLVLLAIRHVTRHGGIKGKLLAPRSLDEYLRKPLPALVVALSKGDIHALSPEDWYRLYRAIVDDPDVPKLQRKKLEAFFEAFHRFMVINGAEPLQRSIAGKSRPMPPAAVVVWPHELELAVQFIWASDCSDFVKRQAELGLRLAYHVPMRIEDLWCLRMTDVHVEAPCWIAICSRQRDGYGKSPAQRRQADVEGATLISVLHQVYWQRKGEKAGDEDVLLGEPGVPDGRHEEQLTTRLMNEALRWATGNPSASYHDLRHTRISAMSEPVFAGQDEDSDVGAMQQISAASGHAGPGSTLAYLHLIEEAIAKQAAAARPSAWSERADLASSFEDVAFGLVAPEPLTPGPVRLRSPRTAADLTLSERRRLLQWVIDESSLEAVASICRVRAEVVKTVVREMCGALQWARLAEHEQTASTRLQSSLLRTLWLPARAALQPKHDLVVAALESAIAAEHWRETEGIWNAWLRCHHGPDVDVTNTAAAVRLVSFLLKAGVPPQTLLVVSHDAAPPLPPELARHRISQRVVVDRSGRQYHRLQMCDLEQVASEASGASLSMQGIHWWMLCLGSMVLSHGERDETR